MKTKKNKNHYWRIIIGLFISGTLLMVLSTFFFSFKIPQLDSDISQKEREMENFWKNSSMYVNADLAAYMAKTANGIASLSTSSDLQKETMDITGKDWINYKILQIRLTYDKKNEPPAAEIENWKKLPIDQLENTVSKKFEEFINEHNATTVKEYNRLNSTKKTVVFWSILFQIIGILLNQSGIILQLIKPD